MQLAPSQCRPRLEADVEQPFASDAVFGGIPGYSISRFVVLRQLAGAASLRAIGP